MRNIIFYRFASKKKELFFVRTKLQLLGHDFNDRGELCQFDVSSMKLTSNKFEYENENKQLYKQIGNAATEYIYHLLESEPLNFKRVLYGRNPVKNLFFIF